MTAFRDYYEVLGVTRNADMATVKKAYRNLVKKYHPDAKASQMETAAEFMDMENRFQEVKEAYGVLGDETKRKLYDLSGGMYQGGKRHSHSPQREGGGRENGHFSKKPSDNDFPKASFDKSFHKNSSKNSFQKASFENIDQENMEGTCYNSLGEEGLRKSGLRVMGKDLTDRLEISFEEAAFGCDKIVYYRYPDGFVEPLKVHIPAGIDSGKKICLEGKGLPGLNGGDPGNLILEIRAGVKNGFVRKDMDVYTTAYIPFPTAVLGGEIAVETLYGEIRCRIPEGIQAGTRLRLRGKGIVSMQNATVTGNHYVTIQIQVPRNLSMEAKEKLRAYGNAVNGCGKWVRGEGCA